MKSPRSVCATCLRPMRPHGRMSGCPYCLAATMAADFGITTTEPAVPGFELKYLLGEGSAGVVWFALDTGSEEGEVALKILKPGLAGSEAGIRFQVEMQALELMDHPGIARVFDSGRTRDGRPYFVMEWIEGESLMSAVDHLNLSPPERLEVFERICSAVAHAHEKGIIHRDLKPSNILLGSDRQPKVIDFGIARATQDILADRTLVTRDGQMIGTPAYMSPEQAAMRGEMLDERSDIYSLGVVLYELLTGKLPIKRDLLDHAPYDEVLREIRTGKIPNPSDNLPSGVGNGVGEVLLKALAKNPADRFQSVAELWSALREAGQVSVRFRVPRRLLFGGLVVLGTIIFLLAAPWKKADPPALTEPQEPDFPPIASHSKIETGIGNSIKAASPPVWLAHGHQLKEDDPGSAIAVWAEARRLALEQNDAELADAISDLIKEAFVRLSPEYATAVHLMLAHDFAPGRGDNFAWISTERRNLYWSRSQADQDSFHFAIKHIGAGPWDRVRWGIAGREAIRNAPALVEAGRTKEAIQQYRQGILMCRIADQPKALMTAAAEALVALQGGNSDFASLDDLIASIPGSELSNQLGLRPKTSKWLEVFLNWHDPESTAFVEVLRLPLLPGWRPLLLSRMGQIEAAGREAERELESIDSEKSPHLAHVLKALIVAGKD